MYLKKGKGAKSFADILIMKSDVENDKLIDAIYSMYMQCICNMYRQQNKIWSSRWDLVLRSTKFDSPKDYQRPSNTSVQHISKISEFNIETSDWFVFLGENIRSRFCTLNRDVFLTEELLIHTHRVALTDRSIWTCCSWSAQCVCWRGGEGWHSALRWSLLGLNAGSRPTTSHYSHTQRGSGQGGWWEIIKGGGHRSDPTECSETELKIHFYSFSHSVWMLCSELKVPLARLWILLSYSDRRAKFSRSLNTVARIQWILFAFNNL